MRTSRWLVLSRVLVIFCMTCLLGAATLKFAACEAAPVLKSQLKGVYRMMVGDFEVIALSDGINMRSVEQQLQLLYGDKEKIGDTLARAYPDGQLGATVNAFLIDTGTKLVLIDTGNGSMGSPAMGKVIDNLRLAGYQPESVDEIYLTHMHGDHVGGLVSGGERAFPKATVYADKREADYWLSDSNSNAAPSAAKTALAPYINAGKFKTFAGSTQLLPGVRAEAAFGHTPGHTAYFIESKGETLVLWGDIVHVAAVQFEDPAVTIAYDSDRAAAAQTRQQILAAAAKNGWLIGGAHLAFPALGQVRASDGGGYIFMPLD